MRNQVFNFFSPVKRVLHFQSSICRLLWAIVSFPLYTILAIILMPLKAVDSLMGIRKKDQKLCPKEVLKKEVALLKLRGQESLLDLVKTEGLKETKVLKIGATFYLKIEGFMLNSAGDLGAIVFRVSEQGFGEFCPVIATLPLFSQQFPENILEEDRIEFLVNNEVPTDPTSFGELS